MLLLIASAPPCDRRLATVPITTVPSTCSFSVSSLLADVWPALALLFDCVASLLSHNDQQGFPTVPCLVIPAAGNSRVRV